jgi:hypothetical protein
MAFEQLSDIQAVSFVSGNGERCGGATSMRTSAFIEMRQSTAECVSIFEAGGMRTVGKARLTSKRWEWAKRGQH